jgi:hypothetical protein
MASSPAATIVTVNVSPESTASANAGADQTAMAGATVQLNGAGLQRSRWGRADLQWSFQLRPAGSSAVLSTQRLWISV